MSEIGVLVGRCSPYHLRLSSPCHPLALPSCNCSLRAAADGHTEPVNFEILSLLIGNSNPFNNSFNCFSDDSVFVECNAMFIFTKPLYILILFSPASVLRILDGLNGNMCVRVYARGKDRLRTFLMKFCI